MSSNQRTRQNTNCPSFRAKTRTFDDPCYVATRERQSRDTGTYQQTNFFRKCNEPVWNDCNLNNLQVYPKVHGFDQCNTNTDSALRYAPLTNLKNVQQLYTRPYKGSYRGAGSATRDNLDIESHLYQGQYRPTLKSCEPTSEVYIDRWEYLPAAISPTKIEHTIEPWTRGGQLTRELVRQLNFGEYCYMINNIKCSNKKWNNPTPRIV
jgi:hypothetical protein